MDGNQTREYWKILNSRLMPFNQNLNGVYTGVLKLLITFAGTVFVGSVSFAHYLGLLSTPYATTITCISWGLLIIAMISLVLALVSFLCHDAKAYAWLVKELNNLAKWFQHPEKEFIPSIEETAIFLPTKSAIIGFVSFMLGFLNFALVLLGKFICVCPLALILANVLVGILIYTCLKPFLQIMNSRID